MALLGDIHRFARRYVAQEFEAQRVQCDALGSHHIFIAAIFKLTLADHQRADTVRVTECQQTVTDDHRYAGVSATQLLMHGGNGGENVVGFQRIMLETIQLTGQYVQQDLGIGGGVDMAAAAFKQLLAQLMGVGQVAVVCQRQAERRVYIKGLSL
ncbi:hypothetical protein D3C78_864810 [compost metagenome]